MLLPNIIRTTAALLAGTFLFWAFNPSTPLRIIIFGGLSLAVFYGGWWFAEYVETVETHNLHVTAQFITVAQQAEHRADWHYDDGHIEVCDIHGVACPIFGDGG